MSRQRTSVTQGILHQVEDRIEQWREQDSSHKAEAAVQWEKLWAAATEREKLLAEAVAEKVHRDSVDEVAKRHRVVFVMHAEEMARAPEAFAADNACLERVVPDRGRLRRCRHERFVAYVSEARVKRPSPQTRSRSRPSPKTRRAKRA